MNVWDPCRAEGAESYASTYRLIGTTVIPGGDLHVVAEVLPPIFPLNLHDVGYRTLALFPIL